MKKLGYLLMLAALILLPACNTEDGEGELVDFANLTYTLYNGGKVAVGVSVVTPVEQNLPIPMDVDGPTGRFSITPPGITIPAGEIAGAVWLEDKGLQEGDRIFLKLNPPAGYQVGRRGQTTVVYDTREALLCTIPGTDYFFTQDMEIVVDIQGVRSGTKYVAEDDLLIPARFTADGSNPDGSAEVTLKERGFVVKKGEHLGRAHIIRAKTTDIPHDMTTLLSIVDFDDSRILSTGPSVKLHIPKTEKSQ